MYEVFYREGHDLSHSSIRYGKFHTAAEAMAAVTYLWSTGCPARVHRPKKP